MDQPQGNFGDTNYVALEDDAPSSGTNGKAPGAKPRKAQAGKVEDLFCVPPVLKGEDKRRYKERLTAFREALEPRSIIGELFIQDVAAHQHQIERLRHINAALLDSMKSGSGPVLAEKEFVDPFATLSQIEHASEALRNRALREFHRHCFETWLDRPKAIVDEDGGKEG